jgi:hypothetical protein
MEQPIVPNFKGHNLDPVKMGAIRCPKESERICYYSLHNSPEESSYYLLRGSSLKSREECQILSATAFFFTLFNILFHENNYETCDYMLRFL